MSTHDRRRFLRNICLGLPLAATVPEVGKNDEVDVEGHLHLEGTHYAMGMKEFRGMPDGEKPFVAKMYGHAVEQTILQHFGLK